MVEANDDTWRTYNTFKQIKFKTAMVKSSLCGYTNSYILVSETITITGAGADEVTRKADEKSKEFTFKNCASFAIKISEINNIQVDNSKDLVVVMPLYNLTEYSSDNYSKISRSLWQYC